MGVDESELRSRYVAAGQGHVFDHYETLTEEKKHGLLKQLESIEVEKLSSLLEAARVDQTKTSSSKGGGIGEEKVDDDFIRPFTGEVARSYGDDDDDDSWKKLMESSRRVGMDAIRKGKVAALVLAGGQGTRLGFHGPKGKYDIGLPSGRTLFQMISERLLKLSILAKEEEAEGGGVGVGVGGGVGGRVGESEKKEKGEQEEREDVGGKSPSIPLYVMTSPINHEETASYFRDHSFFGLPKDDVVFFEQGMLPCLTDDDDIEKRGRIIMEDAGVVAMAPDGNGGIYPSLVKTGALEDMKRREIRCVHVFSIDNSLVRPADPVFVGYCLSKNADCGNKVVWKRHAHEKVGVLAERQGGKPCIVEYSDISAEMAERTAEDDEVDDDGRGVKRLVFGAGNICNHYYTLDFLHDVIAPNLDHLYHIANKKIPYYDAHLKRTVHPEKNNGIKLESFIFDVFPLSKRMTVLDVLRSDEFAPVKNAPGPPPITDNPDTARRMISQLFQKWVTNAGGTLVLSTTTSKSTSGADDADDDVCCEIAPSTSYAGEGLEHIVKGKEIQCPFVL